MTRQRHFILSKSLNHIFFNLKTLHLILFFKKNTIQKSYNFAPMVLCTQTQPRQIATTILVTMSRSLVRVRGVLKISTVNILCIEHVNNHKTRFLKNV